MSKGGALRELVMVALDYAHPYGAAGRFIRHLLESHPARLQLLGAAFKVFSRLSAIVQCLQCMISSNMYFTDQ